jgi:hypothetical protein
MWDEGCWFGFCGVWVGYIVNSLLRPSVVVIGEFAAAATTKDTVRDD